MTGPGTVYPGAVDSFSVPSAPEVTPLSEAGTANLDHTELHEAINKAVISLETNAAIKTHTHDGGPDGTLKLAQKDTHQTPDTDTSTTSIHHTLGPAAGQAAAGNHTHDWNASPPTILNRPYIIGLSTNRPRSPFPGLMFFETDTNFLRIWANLGQGYGWQLIPIQPPAVQVQQSIAQPLRTPGWIQLLWDDVVNDTANFFNAATNAAALIVNEAGLYATNLAVQFDPAVAPDVAKAAVFVNGQISNIQSNVFQRGETYVPGFSQTVAAQGPINLNNGDVVTGAVSYVASQGLGVVNTFVNQTENLASRIGLTFMGSF